MAQNNDFARIGGCEWVSCMTSVSQISKALRKGLVLAFFERCKMKGFVRFLVLFTGVVMTTRSAFGQDVERFLVDTEKKLLELWIASDRADWVRETYINYDTEVIASTAREALMEFVGQKAMEAVKYLSDNLSEEVKRKIDILRSWLDLPAPKDPEKRKELANIATKMDSMYGEGKYCSKRYEGKCLSLPELEEILKKSRDYDELLEVWAGWHAVGAKMKPLYVRFVELANEGARELGFADVGALWRSRYDMSEQEFEHETLRLWGQVEPLYKELHCYVRSKLQEVYGKDKVKDGQPIPAHLLGNMWAQEWTNLFDLLAPEKGGLSLAALDEVFEQKGIDEVQMVKMAEAFFVSLGLDPLPQTFWERSMFTKPKDREVVCHASAWDVDEDEDLRIKMCIKRNGDDFATIHHELGHNYYQRAYRHLSPLFRNSANDGFHEALGDLIALSVTPSYLRKVGLASDAPQSALNTLMHKALEKVAFLPFGLVVDRWRWQVFAGKIKPDQYNKAWWELRRKYQGVQPAIERTEAEFDPGAKYHVPANVPYTRYFLATILQFQFHRALCRKVLGFKGPLHECSIYGNKEAGAKILKMMEMGQSRPWREALEAMTGEKEMDASAILEYFEPLNKFLKRANKGKKCGWQ